MRELNVMLFLFFCYLGYSIFSLITNNYFIVFCCQYLKYTFCIVISDSFSGVRSYFISSDLYAKVYEERVIERASAQVYIDQYMWACSVYMQSGQ